jgi:hypothetical protein
MKPKFHHPALDHFLPFVVNAQRREEPLVPAIISFCEKWKVDPEMVAPLLTPTLKDIIATQVQDAEFLIRQRRWGCVQEPKDLEVIERKQYNRECALHARHKNHSAL